MRRFILYLKGICMGVADVIPGVSGGTIALIVGIYRELVQTISQFHFRWLKPLIRWLLQGQKQDDWRTFTEELKSLNLAFVIPLGFGILTALALGSLFIPALIQNYPEQTRGLFFGLILASAWIPFQMMRQTQRDTSYRFAAIFVGILFALFGYIATQPGAEFQWAGKWQKTTSNGETLDELSKRVPSALPTSRLYWAEQNRALRETIKRQKPELAEKLGKARPDRKMSLQALKKSRDKQLNIYNELQIPEGAVVQIPQLAFWYIFLAGMIAICAMILPGISGSYLLLIFGCYFFILNGVKGFLMGIETPGQITSHVLYIGTFGVGAIIGLFSFAKLLDYLLSNWPEMTFAGLVGLMLGCLRGVWPFRKLTGGTQVNTIPEVLNSLVLTSFGFAVLGVIIVAALTLYNENATVSEQ